LVKWGTQAWLDQHGPFDAIVDAANVALHNQNFGDGGFNFYQVDYVNSLSVSSNLYSIEIFKLKMEEQTFCLPMSLEV
jgi:hypothetical protein